MGPLTASYDLLLVVLSFLVSAFGSYTALRLAHHAGTAFKRGKDRFFWVASAAIALGAGGIWSMHFIAMAALQLPVPVRYDLVVTALSLLVAVGSTALGLLLGICGPWNLGRAVTSGCVMGLGIASMHYVGMAAMRMPGSVTYDNALVAVSVVIGVGASVASVILAGRPRTAVPPWVAALLMAVAVSGMHYVGMSAANFTREPRAAAITTLNVTPAALAYAAFLITIVILSIQLALAANPGAATTPATEQ